MAALTTGLARRTPGLGRPGALRPGFHLAPGMRVGLFGGSFNPAHGGHAHVAETALMRLGLDRVIWLVSPQNPLKPEAGMAPLAQRMASARRFGRGPAMIVSDVETRLGSAYTIDTVRRLKARFPGVRFVWLMGADNLAGFHRWRGWAELMRALPVAVVARPGAQLTGRFAPAARRFAHGGVRAEAARSLHRRSPPSWIYLAAPLNTASSTAIREGATEALVQPPTGRDPAQNAC
jgi:nicotinate-nucleotide adenylyltransferase